MKTTYILIILIIGLVLVGGCIAPAERDSEERKDNEGYGPTERDTTGDDKIPTPPALPSG